jgi:LysR family hydrogen peroxide-inducible transcriptional activator
MIRPPTLAQLRALVALADTLHFGEAAASLRVSQPSVSAALGALEASLGVELAERSTRRVILTPTGHEVAAQAREILNSVDHLVGTASRAGRPYGGPLRLGVIPTVAPYILAPVLGTIARRFPDVAPEVSEGQTAQLLEELLEGRLDAVVLAVPCGRSDVAEDALYWEEFVLLVPPDHALAGATDLSPAVLRHLPLLLLEEGHCLAAQALDICRQVGAPTDHPARATSLTTIAQLVAAGLGTTLLPATALAVETRKGKVAVAHFRPPAPGRQIGLVFRPGSARAGEYHGLAEALRKGLDRPGFAGRPGQGPALHFTRGGPDNTRLRRDAR